MPDQEGLWRLAGFDERFERWAAIEKPSAELRLVVAEWILSRMEDPYAGARREPGFANLWSVRIRGSAEGTRTSFTVTICSFWINETSRIVECDSFSTLSHPA